MNKKGNLVAIATLGIIVMVVIMGAFLVTLGSGILTYSWGTVTEVTNSLGMVSESANLSAISEVSIGTVNDTLQMLSFGSGVFIIFALLGIIIFAASIRSSPNGFLIGLYLLMVIIMIFVAIFMSNTYESFLDSNDVIGQELQSMTMASFLVLYMPTIITVLGFIGGIIIFSGIGGEFS